MIPRAEIEVVGDRITELAMGRMRPPPLRVILCGSYRRGRTDSTDIDVLVVVRDMPSRRARASSSSSAAAPLLTDTSGVAGADGADGAAAAVENGAAADADAPTDATHEAGAYKLHHLLALLDILREDGLLTDDLALPKDGSGRSGELAGNFYMGIYRHGPSGLHRRIDIRCFEEHEQAAALLHCTGSGQFNRVVQRAALVQGMQLSEKGLCAAVKRAPRHPQGGSLPAARVGGRDLRAARPRVPRAARARAPPRRRGARHGAALLREAHHQAEARSGRGRRRAASARGGAPRLAGAGTALREPRARGLVGLHPRRRTYRCTARFHAPCECPLSRRNTVATVP